MIVNLKYRVGLEQVGRENLITNKALLIMLEDIAGYHSSNTGTALSDIGKTGMAWVLLNWKMKVIKRPKFGDEVIVSTWSSDYDKISALRDFEIRSETGELLVICTSRWILMDINKRRPIRVTDEIIEPYETEKGRRVFDSEIEKISIPESDYISNNYEILRRDMDYLGHMHNISYLEIAYDTMPEEVYKGPEFNEISIEYRKEISEKTIVTTHFYKADNGCIITINTDKTNAVISLTY